MDQPLAPGRQSANASPRAGAGGEEGGERNLLEVRMTEYKEGGGAASWRIQVKLATASVTFITSHHFPQKHQIRDRKRGMTNQESGLHQNQESRTT